MTRRMYFLFPDSNHTKGAVDDLVNSGVKYENIHCVARKDVDISALPPATRLQKYNFTDLIEHVLWAGNLMLFFVALAVFVYLLTWSSPVTAIIPFAVTIVCFFSGKYYVTHVPHTHLSEFQNALGHREILLMVDVSKKQSRDTVRIVHQHHPECIDGGVGWAIKSLHI